MYIFSDSKVTSPMAMVSQTIDSTSATDFITQVAAELTANPYSSSQNARATIAGLIQALSSPDIQPRSHVYVVVGGPAEDSILRVRALDAIARTHAYVCV